MSDKYYAPSYRSFSDLESSATAEPPSSCQLFCIHRHLVFSLYIYESIQSEAYYYNPSLRTKKKPVLFYKKGFQLTNRAQLLDIKPHGYMKPQYKTHHLHDKNIVAIKVHQLLKSCTVW